MPCICTALNMNNVCVTWINIRSMIFITYWLPLPKFLGNTAKQLQRMKTLATYKHLLWLFSLIRLNLTNPIWTNWKQFLSVSLVMCFYRCWMQMCSIWHSWCDSLSAGWEIKGNWGHIFRVFWGLFISGPAAMKFQGKKNRLCCQ